MPLRAGGWRKHNCHRGWPNDCCWKKRRACRCFAGSAKIGSVLLTESNPMPTGLLDGERETEVRDLLTFLLREPPQRSKEGLARMVSQEQSQAAQPGKQLRMVLVVSKQDHGPGQHDYPAWQTNWSRLLSILARGTLGSAHLSESP